jgi:hypothetical protein
LPGKALLYSPEEAAQLREGAIGEWLAALSR